METDELAKLREGLSELARLLADLALEVGRLKPQPSPLPEDGVATIEKAARAMSDSFKVQP